MEHHHTLCFLFVRGLATIFLVGGLGVEKKENGRHERPIVPDVIFFSGTLEQSGSLQTEITNTS